MIRSLIQTGNSKALILTKDMRDHLGVEETLDVEFRKGCLILRHPETAPLEDSEVIVAKAKPVKRAPASAAPAKAKVEAKPKEKAKDKDKPKDKKDKSKGKKKAKS